MTVVVDASVALKWVVDEPGSEQAAALLEPAQDQTSSLVVPEHLFGEVANGLRKRVAQRLLSPTDAGAALAAIADLELDAVAGVDRWLRCLPVALQWDITTYDALYLLLALDREAELATADRRLADAATRQAVPVRHIGSPHV